MFCRNGMGVVLRKGVAAFLMLIVISSGFVFAGNVFAETRVEANEGAVLFAQEDTSEISYESVKKSEKNSKSNKQDLPTEQTVNLYFTKTVRYENYQTHDYYVKCNGEKIRAYCIEPTLTWGGSKTYKAKEYNKPLMRKALYYSYYYPGYNKKTKAYMKKLSLPKDYKKNYGAYAFCHVMLSYIYDGESSKGDAFKGVSKKTKTAVKKLVKEIKKWPDVPETADIELSMPSVTAEWNFELMRQETPEIEVIGTEGNSINVPVPKGASLIKGDVVKTSGNVKIKVGESFRLVASSDLTGSYKSPEMAGSIEAFQPYLLKPKGKQGELFSVSKVNTVSYDVEWIEWGSLELNKISTEESLTENNEYYSLDGAEYGLYKSDTDLRVGTLKTDENGKATLTNIPYGKYYLKEENAPQGYLIDEETHNIEVDSEYQSEAVSEKPNKPNISTEAYEKSSGKNCIRAGGKVTITDKVRYENLTPGLEYTVEGRIKDKETGNSIDCVTQSVTFVPENESGSVTVDFTVNSSKLGGKKLVVFEKLYYEESLIASHEDLNAASQCVEVLHPADSSPATGDDIPEFLNIAMILLMTIAAIIATAVLLKKE